MAMPNLNLLSDVKAFPLLAQRWAMTDLSDVICFGTHFSISKRRSTASVDNHDGISYIPVDIVYPWSFSGIAFPGAHTQMAENHNEVHTVAPPSGRSYNTEENVLYTAQYKNQYDQLVLSGLSTSNKDTNYDTQEATSTYKLQSIGHEWPPVLIRGN